MKKITTLCLFIVIAVAVNAQHPCLINHWPMDNNANDVTANPNNGTVVGATLTTDRFNNPNSAYSFDGVDDYIDLSTYLQDLTTVTLSVWVKYTGTNQGVVFADADNVGNNDFYLDFAGSGIGVKADKGAATLIYSNGGAATGLSNLDQWNHVAWVMTPNQSKLYFNGNTVHSVTEACSQVGFHSSFAAIGYFNDGVVNLAYFEGVLDNLQIFDCILDSAEIDSIYNYVPVGINQSAINNNPFTIYPNPTEGKFEVRSLELGVEKVEVYDVYGRAVLTTKEPEIDMRGYAKGMYFVKLGDAVRKLVIE